MNPNIANDVVILTEREFNARLVDRYLEGYTNGKSDGAAALKGKPIDLTMRKPPNEGSSGFRTPQVELFCWGPQREAIAAALPGVRLRPVFSAEQMCGLKAGVWALANSHEDGPPSEIWQQIMRGGGGRWRESIPATLAPKPPADERDH